MQNFPCQSDLHRTINLIQHQIVQETSKTKNNGSRKVDDEQNSSTRVPWKKKFTIFSILISTQLSFYDNQRHKAVLCSVTRKLVKKNMCFSSTLPKYNKKSHFSMICWLEMLFFFWFVWKAETRKNKFCKWFYVYMVLLHVQSVTCGDRKTTPRKFPTKISETISKIFYRILKQKTKEIIRNTTPQTCLQMRFNQSQWCLTFLHLT